MVVRFELRLAPIDLALFRAMAQGTDSLGSPATLDAAEGRIEFGVPQARRVEAEAALRTLAAWLPLRVERSEIVADPQPG